MCGLVGRMFSVLRMPQVMFATMHSGVLNACTGDVPGAITQVRCTVSNPAGLHCLTTVQGNRMNRQG